MNCIGWMICEENRNKLYLRFEHSELLQNTNFVSELDSNNTNIETMLGFV